MPESDTHSPEAKGRYAALASAIARAGTGDAAALARLSADDLQPHQVAALVRALLVAGLTPEHWPIALWTQWALIAHGMALAGHDGSRSLGKQLADANVAESRVTKLLIARGEAFSALVPRLLRLLASKGVKPNWNDLGRLIQSQASSEVESLERAEEIRLKIASSYFSAVAKKDRQSAV
jgi:CRISPR system Cascade subunit CasB